MGFNIFLNQYKKKKGSQKTMILPVDLEQEAKQYMQEVLEGDISQVDIYDKERQACTEIRLNVNVVPVISNVLTNYKTEIVRFEGSDSAMCINYANSGRGVQNTVAVSGTDIETNKGNTNLWNGLTSVRDSQLSRSGLGYTYHCGMDFFSNYHFRTDKENFKTVCQTKVKDFNYNTLFDYMREEDGSNVDDCNEYSNYSTIRDIHLFTAEEVLSPEEAVNTYQMEKDGWYGFKNISRLRAYDDNGECLDIHSPICNRASNDFIDLTPERDLFTFFPKWNSYRSRDEKNWNYVITYPYSSTTDVNFIRSSTHSLKLASYDEIGNNGYTYFTSVSKHGLKDGDYVNIYSGDEVVMANAKVVWIGSGDTDSKRLNSDYIFAVKKDRPISMEWLKLDTDKEDEESEEDYQEKVKERVKYYPILGTETGIVDTYGEGAYYTLDGNMAFDSTKSSRDGQVPVPIFTRNFICANLNELDLSFKRVDNGMECDYYVRINAKLPNFKGAMEVIDEYSVQNSDKLIEDYSMHSNNLFSNENARLAFARTIYQDDMGSMTYTENIPFTYLQNNRKCPLSDIFFTIFKNNKGYKKWYENKLNPDIQGDDIEYSHVFGKLTCAFELSRASELVYDTETQPRYKTIHTINNIDSVFSGMDISVLNKGYRADDDELDEVNWEKNRFFYNDLVEYSKGNSLERTIQQVQFRFNTAQRELGDNVNFSGISFDTIIQDDYDFGGFKTGEEKYINGQEDDPSGEKRYNLFYQKEGYYYQPHYRIPVRTVSATKQKSYSTVVQLRKDTDKYGDNQVLIVTVDDNYASVDTKVIFHNSTYDTYLYGVVKEIRTTNSFVADLYKDIDLTTPVEDVELDNIVARMQNAPKSWHYIKPNTENPSYADFLTDGSFMFQWREILANGYDDNDEEVYPFANNYLYVDKKIIFFLRRQWWDRLEKVNTTKFPTERSGLAVDTYEFDEYVDDEDIDCMI